MIIFRDLVKCDLYIIYIFSSLSLSLFLDQSKCRKTRRMKLIAQETEELGKHEEEETKDGMLRRTRSEK